MSNVNCLQDNIQIKNYICKILMLICQHILQHGDTGSFDVAGSAAAPDHWRNALQSHELSPNRCFGQCRQH